MIIVKCRLCGNDVKITDNENEGTCEHCGSKIILEEKIANQQYIENESEDKSLKEGIENYNTDESGDLSGEIDSFEGIELF